MTTVSKAFFWIQIFTTLAMHVPAPMEVDMLLPEKCIVAGHEVGSKCGSLAKIRKNKCDGLEYVPFEGITACCNLNLEDNPALERKIAEIPDYIARCNVLGSLYHPHQAEAYHWTTFDIKTEQDVKKCSKIPYEEFLEYRSNFTTEWGNAEGCRAEGTQTWPEVAKAIDQQDLQPELRLLSAQFNPHRARPELYDLTDTGKAVGRFLNGIDGSGSQGCLHLGNGIFLNDTSIKLEGQCKVGQTTCGRRTTEDRADKCNVSKPEFLAGSHDKDIAKIGKLVYGEDKADSHREWHMTIAYAHSPRLIEMRIERFGNAAVAQEFQELLAGHQLGLDGKPKTTVSDADNELAKREFEALVKDRSHRYSEKFYDECLGLKDLIEDTFGSNVIPVKKNQLTLFKDMSVFYEWNGHFEDVEKTTTGESYMEITHRHEEAEYDQLCRADPFHVPSPHTLQPEIDAMVAYFDRVSAGPYVPSHSMSYGTMGC